MLVDWVNPNQFVLSPTSFLFHFLSALLRLLNTLQWLWKGSCNLSIWFGDYGWPWEWLVHVSAERSVLLVLHSEVQFELSIFVGKRCKTDGVSCHIESDDGYEIWELHFLTFIQSLVNIVQFNLEDFSFFRENCGLDSTAAMILSLFYIPEPNYVFSEE